MSLLARFKVNRRNLEADSELSQALFTHILELRGPSPDYPLFDRQADFVRGAGFVHLQLMNALQSRQLDRLKGMSPDLYSSELARWRIGDLMTTWKRARQLNMNSDR